MTIGDPLDRSVSHGPQNHKSAPFPLCCYAWLIGAYMVLLVANVLLSLFPPRAHLDSLLKYVEDGVKEGATLVHGGKRLPRPGLRKLICALFSVGSAEFVLQFVGFFLEPAVFVGAEDHMMVAKEESFGPVMVISVFENG